VRMLKLRWVHALGLRVHCIPVLQVVSILVHLSLKGIHHLGLHLWADPLARMNEHLRAPTAGSRPPNLDVRLSAGAALVGLRLLAIHGLPLLIVNFVVFSAPRALISSRLLLRGTLTGLASKNVLVLNTSLMSCLRPISLGLYLVLATTTKIIFVLLHLVLGNV